MAEPNFLEDDAEGNPFLDENLFPTADPADDASDDAGPADGSQLTPEQLQQLQNQAAMVQRFYDDPAYARQILLERAQQLGLQIQEPQRQQPQTPQGPPAEYVETVKQSLSPEMQFLAPQIAAATWTATQAAIEPVRRQQQTQQQQQLDASYAAMAQQLSDEAPGWERYEDDMLGLLTFLRGAVTGSGSMTHPKYGSALKVLYRLASGDAQATATAGRRMQQALRNGTRTSQASGRTQGPDLQTMIDKAETPQQKWALAYRHALREHGAA